MSMPTSPVVGGHQVGGGGAGLTVSPPPLAPARTSDVLTSPPPPLERRAATRSANNKVRSRPGDPRVISGILASFDELALSPPLKRDESPSQTAGLHGASTRPRSRLSHSSDATATSLPASLIRRATSPGFGMEYGSSAALAEGDEDSMLAPHAVAPPPAIRTSRPPSGLSRYHAPSPSPARSHTHTNALPARRFSAGSFAPSFSIHARPPRDDAASSRLGRDSWTPRASSLQDTPHLPPRSAARAGLTRIPSRDPLNPLSHADGVQALLTPPQDDGGLSRAEQIIARTPGAPTRPKRERLYLHDPSLDDEGVAMNDPSPSPSRVLHVDSSPESEANVPASEHISPPHLAQMKPSILDSIPTRTSSLRQPSTNPHGATKKEKKLKRQTLVNLKFDGTAGGTADDIPESSWADLGEDDETVKRIRELREKRKSRIEEATAPLPVVESVPNRGLERPELKHPPIKEDAAARGEGARRSAGVRPSANRASTGPNSKAHKVLGISDNAPKVPLTNAATIVKLVPKSSASQDGARGPRPAAFAELIGNRAASNQHAASSSPTTPLSLDYSYAHAVEALQGAGRAVEQNSRPSSRDFSVKRVRKASDAMDGKIAAQGLNLSSSTSPKTQPASVRASSQPSRAKSKRGGSQRDRRANLPDHPDLPRDFERRKSRRKSVSDTRYTRFTDDEVEPPRRDSIEDAVLEYLRASRLTRKVKHPLTGRVIAFSEVGDPEGAAVFICVGMGLTRYVTAFYDELATTLKLRLITIDRPGVGGSEPYPNMDHSGPLHWPDDVLVICQHLGVAEFSMLAHSAGAIYALATALILPQMVRGKVHLLAPWIPPSQLEAVPHPTAAAPPAGALPRGQRILRVLPASFLKAANASFMTATSASLRPANRRQLSVGRERGRERQASMSPDRNPVRPPTRDQPDYHRRESLMLMDQYMPTTTPIDAFPIPVHDMEEKPRLRLDNGLDLSATTTPTDPNFSFASTALNAAEHAERERKLEYTSRLTQRTWELATQDSNPATDLLVCLERNRAVGFRYTDVIREVVITHGSEDRRVPLGNVKWLAGQMNARAQSGYAGHDNLPRSREDWADGAFSRGGCEVRVLEGEGHGLMASAPIMSDILTEIAGYYVGHEKAWRNM